MSDVQVIIRDDLTGMQKVVEMNNVEHTSDLAQFFLHVAWAVGFSYIDDVVVYYGKDRFTSAEEFWSRKGSISAD